MEDPCFSAGTFLPAFSDTTLRKVIVVDGYQTFIDNIIDRQDISFLRFKGTQGQCFGALDSDGNTGSDVFGQSQVSGNQQRYQKKDQQYSD